MSFKKHPVMALLLNEDGTFPVPATRMNNLLTLSFHSPTSTRLDSSSEGAEGDKRETQEEEQETKGGSDAEDEQKLKAEHGGRGDKKAWKRTGKEEKTWKRMEEKKDKKELVRQEILLGEKAAATQSGEDQPG
jgi:hypothetical protein